MAGKLKMMSVVELEKCIEALESRNAFQDDVIEQLNCELAIHQAQITELKVQLQLIARRLKDNTPDQGSVEEIEPPPPHY